MSKPPTTQRKHRPVQCPGTGCGGIATWQQDHAPGMAKYGYPPEAGYLCTSCGWAANAATARELGSDLVYVDGRIRGAEDVEARVRETATMGLEDERLGELGRALLSHLAETAVEHHCVEVIAGREWLATYTSDALGRPVTESAVRRALASLERRGYIRKVPRHKVWSNVVRDQLSDYPDVRPATVWEIRKAPRPDACAHCGARLRGRHGAQVYCSDGHRKAAFRERSRVAGGTVTEADRKPRTGRTDARVATEADRKADRKADHIRARARDGSAGKILPQGPPAQGPQGRLEAGEPREETCPEHGAEFFSQGRCHACRLEAGTQDLWATPPDLAPTGP